ncbi:MAG: Rrf2 family transcriptional regulator [Thermoleophilaceae bacterium]
MRISAKVDYAVRAAAELAGAGKGPLKGERISVAQDIPVKFLENILLDLKVAGIVASQRGPGGRLLAGAARLGDHDRRRDPGGGGSPGQRPRRAAGPSSTRARPRPWCPCDRAAGQPACRARGRDPRGRGR